MARRAATPPGDRLLRGQAHRPDAAEYADTLAHLSAAIRLYRDTFRRLGLLDGHGQGSGDDDGQGRQSDGEEPTGKTSERFKVACACQPPRSFWIRRKQYASGPITCGACGHDFQPADHATGPERAASRV